MGPRRDGAAARGERRCYHEGLVADVCKLKRALAVGAPRYCVLAEGGAAKCYDRAIVLNPLGFDCGTENHRCCKKQQSPHGNQCLLFLSYSRLASSSLE